MQGKVVAITGAGRGIGAAAARAFAAEGARVVLLGRSLPEIEALAAGIGPQAMALRCDVTDWSQMQAAIAATVARFGRLDVFIGNAGVIEPIARLSDADPTEWSRAIDVMLKGVFHGMRAALPVMRAQGAGTIITLSSGAAVRPSEGWSAYCSAKAGALMLTKVAHLEEAAQGLRIMGLSPGSVATDMQNKIRASGMGTASRRDPAEDIPADWVARALVWMCGAGADRWLGQDVSLREEDVRRAVGVME